MYSWGIAFLFFVAITLFSLYEKKDKNGRKYIFPPGPKGLPFFGNVFQIPSFGASVVMKPWAEQFGEMYAYSKAKLIIGFVYGFSQRTLCT